MFAEFEKHESNVRSYCRNFPIVFNEARGGKLYSESGEEYIDFFAGAGAMNYGHNNPYIKKKILEYLSKDCIIHALDMYTVEKRNFIKTFRENILEPKNLDYKIMFCGSTGTNAVEAALKLARKNTKRTNVFAFSGAFHGMTLGSLALTSDTHSRGGAGVPLNNVTFMPYSTQFDDYRKSIEYIEWAIKDDHSGIDKPAAMILETIQAEGGINVADENWLREIRRICSENDIIMICDDIQVGVCRSGGFFSFERAGIVPDMVVMSKSISGFGLPMSILLMKPEFDIFTPAEHNGTFRGNQLAFVGAAAGIEFYRQADLPGIVKKNEAIIKEYLESEILPMDKRLSARGIGMIWGIDFSEIDPALSKTAMQECVKNGVVIERAGRNDCVLKILPTLVIEEEDLRKGLQVVKNAVEKVLKECGK